MKRWHAPGTTVVVAAENDLSVGGAWSVHMRNAQGEDHFARGEYREVDPPRRLIYTWGWDDPNRVQQSVVTVEFEERGDATEVIVRHAGLATEDSRAGHTQGWLGGLEQLQALVENHA